MITSDESPHMTWTLNDTHKTILLHVMTEWAANHPRPDEVIMSAGPYQYSPNSLARDLEGNTDAAQLYYKIVSVGGSKFFASFVMGVSQETIEFMADRRAGISPEMLD